MFRFSRSADAICVADIVSMQRQTRPDDLAFVSAAKTLSWKEFDDAVTGAAATLVRHGATKGDRIAFYLKNTVDSYVAMFAALRAGAVIAPISTMLKPGSAASLLEDASPRLFVFDDAYADAARTIIAEPGLSRKPKELTPSAVLKDAGAFSPVDLERNDPATLIYSSGTTGLPKGILHNQHARLWMASQCAVAFGVHPHARVLLTTPPHTNGSWMMVLPAIFTGAQTTLLETFSVDSVVEALAHHNPTHAFLVPTQLTMLMAETAFVNADLGSFECIVSAGAPMPDALKQNVMSRMPGVLHELWGLTEGVGTIAKPADLEKHPNSVGRCIPGCEVRIVDDEGADITQGGVGEIAGRSLFLMDAYWNRDDATSALKWTSDSGETLLLTGDIGEVDADGYLYLRGRKKDMIISGGLNIYPIDIETLLRTHDSVLDVCVVGVPDAKWGETPVAVVRLKDGQTANEQDLMTWCNDRADKHQRVSRVVIRDEDFPRNTLGKVLKTDLVEQIQ